MAPLTPPMPGSAPAKPRRSSIYRVRAHAHAQAGPCTISETRPDAPVQRGPSSICEMWGSDVAEPGRASVRRAVGSGRAIRRVGRGL
jgi:hypothetical protein